MKEKIKTSLITTVILLIFLFALPYVVEARSGCCSWHDGVCGCRCCDGTPLSEKCAPYYPSCSSYNSSTQSEEKSYSWIWWIIGIIVIGGIAYNYSKKKK